MTELVPQGLPPIEPVVHIGPGLGHRVVVDHADTTNRFAGRPDPVGKQVIKWEQPWHRDVAYYIASGMTYRQAAEFVSKDYNTIIKLLKQKWFQHNVLSLKKEYGLGDIMEAFRAEVPASFATLVEIRDDIKNPASVRKDSALAIIHQWLGKPTQTVKTEAVIKSDDPVAEVERLKSRIESRKAELGLGTEGTESASPQGGPKMPDSSLASNP